MKKRIVSALSLAMVALTGGIGGVPGTADAKDRPPVNTTLSALRAQPDAWVNTPITFEARFHRLGEIFQPFYTPFDSFSFGNFAAWDMDAQLDQEGPFVDHCPTLYVDRQMKAKTMKCVAELKPYQRFRATGIVRSVFAGRPFIEVTSIEPCDWWRFWWTDKDHVAEAFAGK